MVSTFVLLVITVVVIGVLKVVHGFRHMNSHWKKKGIPYLPNSFSSFITNWKLSLGYITFPDFCQYVYYSYPNAKYVGTLDFAPSVLVRDPELIKNIMVKDFEHFVDHNNFVDEEVDPLFGKNLFFLHGNRWREMRTILSPTFTASKMKFMFDLVSKCSHDFVNYFVDHPELCHMIETKEAFRRYTNDVIATAAFGINVNSMKDRDNEFYIRGIEASTFSSGLLTTFKFIFLRTCPKLAKAMGMSFVSSATSKFFNKIVQETIRAREEQDIVRPDMIHLLMQARDKDNVATVPKITSEDIVSQAFIFFLAGFDTSSTLMCFTAHELAVNQDVQNRLREEIQQQLAEGNGEISYESLSKMSYMDMVVSEALRKYPPVIMGDRLCTKKYELPPPQPGCNSVILEPDSALQFPVYALQRDPKYFPNPDKFDPERFSEENKGNIVPYTYLPFGHGPRKCIGNRFALMETKILIAHLLQKFTLKTTEKTVEPIVYSKGDFTPRSANGFWIGLQKREM